MNNLQLPAYPTIESVNHAGELVETKTKDNGFTKLELASLMIAQGLVTKYNLKEPSDQNIIARLSVELATEVLKEANK